MDAAKSRNALLLAVDEILVARADAEPTIVGYKVLLAAAQEIRRVLTVEEWPGPSASVSAIERTTRFVVVEQVVDKDDYVVIIKDRDGHGGRVVGRARTGVEAAAIAERIATLLAGHLDDSEHRGFERAVASADLASLSGPMVVRVVMTVGASRSHLFPTVGSISDDWVILNFDDRTITFDLGSGKPSGERDHILAIAEPGLLALRSLAASLKEQK